MAIKHQHANRIYRGVKQFEFRRLRPRFTSGMKVFIYEPVPVRVVSGFFYVAGLVDVENNLDGLEPNQRQRVVVESYLQGARRPTAIGIARPQRLDYPVSLASLGVMAVPQSYVYVPSS